VIAVDKDPVKIVMARQRAAELGVAHRIEFRVGDSFEALSKVKADAVITSPPWAAPAWYPNRRFSTEDLCSRQKGGLAGVLKISEEIAPLVVPHEPKTIHMSQTVEVSREQGFGHVEIEHVSVEEWKNSSNAVLYIQRSCEGGELVEPTVSEVVLDPKSVLPQRSYA
jgi:23S rRNA G2445 N2-methylase RlmL